MGGKFMVGVVSAENRPKTGVAGGDAVDVELEVDTQPREVTVPADFAQVLKANPAVPSYQVEDEEGRIYLLIHLPIEDGEHRWCLWRPDQAGFDFSALSHN
jgi:hypothetical protein